VSSSLARPRPPRHGKLIRPAASRPTGRASARRRQRASWRTSWNVLGRAELRQRLPAAPEAGRRSPLLGRHHPPAPARPQPSLLLPRPLPASLFPACYLGRVPCGGDCMGNRRAGKPDAAASSAGLLENAAEGRRPRGRSAPSGCAAAAPCRSGGLGHGPSCRARGLRLGVTALPSGPGSPGFAVDRERTGIEPW